MASTQGSSDRTTLHLVGKALFVDAWMSTTLDRGTLYHLLITIAIFIAIIISINTAKRRDSCSPRDSNRGACWANLRASQKQNPDMTIFTSKMSPRLTSSPPPPPPPTATSPRHQRDEDGESSSQRCSIQSHRPASLRDAIVLDMREAGSRDDDRSSRDRGRRVQPSSGPSRTSRSPTTRHSERQRSTDRTRDRSPAHRRHREHRRTAEDRRKRSVSPSSRDSRERARHRNRGRELLEHRSRERNGDSRKNSSYRSSRSPTRKRHRSRSASPLRRGHRHARRGSSASPPRREGTTAGASHSDRKRRAASPLARSRKRSRSPDRRSLHEHSESSLARARGSEDFDQHKSSTRHRHERLSTRTAESRHRSPPRTSSLDERAPDQPPRHKGHHHGKARQGSPRSHWTPEPDHIDSGNAGRVPSPPSPRGHQTQSISSSRIGSQSTRPSEDSRYRRPSTRDTRDSVDRRARSRSVEEQSEEMAYRGYHGAQHGYNQHQQMPAAFPMKPQYPQPPYDPRQYSQSPQHHMTPNSFHGSPGHSPYSVGRGGWTNQHSPPP